MRAQKRRVARVWSELVERLEDLKKQAYRIDTQRFADEILDMLRKMLDHKLNKKLALDDLWLNSLLIEGELVEELEDEPLREALIKLMLRALDGEENIMLVSTGTSGSYELRAVVNKEKDKAGVVLLARDTIIEGERVIKEFGKLPIRGEIYKVEAEEDEEE